mgnify:CR=1 FL=1
MTLGSKGVKRGGRRIDKKKKTIVMNENKREKRKRCPRQGKGTRFTRKQEKRE